MGKAVLSSADGETWTEVGTGFATGFVGRIALAAQVQNAGVVYAFVARDPEGTLHGVYRLDITSGKWKSVGNLPPVLPLDDYGKSQGDYDLAIAVDPQNQDIIYIGGSWYGEGASIWRCDIKPAGTSFRAVATSIGEHAHSDVHVLVHTPNEPNQLWATSDGGVFLNRDPRASGTFAARNTDLACLCPNFIGQHPTDPNILFAGLQDNGTARTSGGSSWRWVNWGDGGYCLVNWNDPSQVLIFSNGWIYRTTTGGEDETEYTEKEFPWVTMTQPIVGLPYNAASPDDAKIVAAATGDTVHLSTDFGATWREIFSVGTPVFALTFASATRLFAGTTDGEIYVAERSGNVWNATPVDVAALGPSRTVTDIAVDWADPSLQSFYAAFAGMGDYRHVWHYDGTRWSARSGTAGSFTELLDVEHNALAVDRLDA